MAALLYAVGIHTFSVEAQDGTHMNMIGARGDCKLAITGDSELLCALASTRQVVGVWPFNTLRRYWCGDGIFGFEAGKRSPRGEGIFTFISSQDEEIYSTMKRYIEKAKQTTLQRKRYEQGALERVSDVNMRPKLPLPRDVASPETPVFSSGSDDEMTTKVNENEDLLQYESIPVQRDDLVGVSPPGYPPPLRRGISLHTDISGPSPAYMLKRSQTSKPRQVQQWVNNIEVAMQKLGEDQLMESGGDDPLVAQDDMYSHTQHIIPAPFHQHATDHNIIDESSYHTLVHNGKPAAMKGKRGRGEDDGGDNLYSLAYPPTDGATRGRVLSGNEYGTLETIDGGSSRTRTLSNLPLAPAKTAGEREVMDEDWRSVPHYPLKYSASPPQVSTSVLEDSMTDNPMYNSQADMLEALANSRRESRTASPEQPGELEGEGRLDSELTEEERDRNIPEHREEGGEEGGEIKRDSKGYTKVDKSKKKMVSEVDMDMPDSEAPPPPLPPRLYEGAEDELGLQSHSDAMKEPLSPLSECDSLPVSDV